MLYFIFRLCINGEKDKTYTPKTISVASIKNKGVVIVKYYSIFNGYSVVIQMNRDTITEVVSKETYKRLSVHDIII